MCIIPLIFFRPLDRVGTLFAPSPLHKFRTSNLPPPPPHPFLPPLTYRNGAASSRPPLSHHCPQDRPFALIRVSISCGVDPKAWPLYRALSSEPLPRNLPAMFVLLPFLPGLSLINSPPPSQTLLLSLPYQDFLFCPHITPAFPLPPPLSPFVVFFGGLYDGFFFFWLGGGCVWWVGVNWRANLPVG